MTKVLHLSTFDTAGGAARAAYRIHQGLREIGADSQMLVRNKTSDDRAVMAPRSLAGKVIGRLRGSYNALPLRSYPTVDYNAFSPQWLPDGLLSRVAKINPDIINLHWVSNGFLRIETIAQFKQPVVWTLMDMWSFTGGCHYTQGCDRYTASCGACPQLHSQQEQDLSRRVWQRKATWQRVNLTVVAPTSWLAHCARASSLFSHRRIEVIPFGLDTDVFKPLDKRMARQALNLPVDKQLILFGAVEATKDRRKGFHLLQPALQKLSSTGRDVELAVFGSSKAEQEMDLGFRTHYLGRLHDNVSLALAYSAADVMVVPSTQEAFGQTASESLACGTPVVAFKGTGLADIVEHQQNGYLAVPFEIEDLAGGMSWVLEERHRKLCYWARAKAEKEFTLERQARRYQALYAEIANAPLPQQRQEPVAELSGSTR